MVQLAGGKAWPSEVIEYIVRKTDGVPLFVEELTKAVQGSGRSGRRVGATCRPGRSPGWRSRQVCRSADGAPRPAADRARWRSWAR